MIFLFLSSFIISTISTVILKKFGDKYNLCDFPVDEKLKIHKKPIPLLGGLAIFLTFSLLLIIFSYLKNFFNWQILAIIFAGFLVFLIGFWDDLKWKKIGIKPEKKFLFLTLFSLLATLSLFFVDIKIQFFLNNFLTFVLTFIYIFALINAINYQDGIDGLAGGLVAISLIGFIILALIFKNILALVISLILIGAVLGFLIFNFPPAKIFLGDSGSYFLGFILAVLAMIFSKPYNFFSFLGPVFILGVPVFDGIFTNVRRLIQGKSIFLGDRAHFYDKLIFSAKFSITKTLLISYLIQVIFTLIGISIFCL
jgi:UDP-GlcNAc:undecaprenyl-phosphate GlcNAc-1-phosphate transferase